MATYSSILAWGILSTEEPGGLRSMGVTESDTTDRLKHRGLPERFPTEALIGRFNQMSRGHVLILKSYYGCRVEN